MKHELKTLLALIVALASTAPCIAGGTIIRHAGGRNPLSEGWTLNDGSGGAHHFGAVQTPIPPVPVRGSWWIDTETAGASGVGAYESLYPAIADAWKLRVRLRAVDIDTLGGQAVHVGTGIPLTGGETLHFQMRFGMSADGDPMVAVGETALPIEIDGGANEFHKYELLVDTRPHLQISKLLVDGVVRGSAGGYGDVDSLIGIEWGDLDSSSAMNGSALWYLVRFQTAIPEPNSILLAVMGAAGIASQRRKRGCGRISPRRGWSVRAGQNNRGALDEGGSTDFMRVSERLAHIQSAPAFSSAARLTHRGE